MALLRSEDRGSIMSKTFGAGSVRHVLKKIATMSPRGL